MTLDTRLVLRDTNINYWKHLKKVVFVITFLFFLYSLLCLVFIPISNKENKATNEHFFKKAPDVIVVFTGDIGRVPFAFKKAIEYPQAKVFITGVFSKNTVTSLLAQNGFTNIDQKIDTNQLEIEYLARNTVENVIATLNFLRKQKEINEVLIASHDYHILRIQSIINKLKSPEDNFTFYYTGISTSYRDWRNIKIIYKEVYKLIRTYGFLMLLNIEDEPLTKPE